MIQKHERCYWRHRPTGGFGHLMNIPCLFLEWCDDGRVLVEVLHGDGARSQKRIDGGHVVRVIDGRNVPLADLRRVAVTA